MRRKSVWYFLFTFMFLGLKQASGELRLEHQAALEMLSYPDITQGIIDLLYMDIEYLWHQGAYERIFPIYRIITTIGPNDVEAWAVGGWFLINGVAPIYSREERQQIERYGIKFIKKGIEKNPEDARLYWELSWIFYSKGDFDRSLEYLQKAEKYPHDFKVEHLKAHIYMKKNMKDEAINEWQKISEKYPENKYVADRFIRQLKQDSN